MLPSNNCGYIALSSIARVVDEYSTLLRQQHGTVLELNIKGFEKSIPYKAAQLIWASGKHLTFVPLLALHRVSGVLRASIRNQ